MLSILYQYFIIENILFSSNDIEYHLMNWVKLKNKKLFITGYTGSGKTTLAKKLGKKYNTKVISLDQNPNLNKQYIRKLKHNNKINKLKNYYQDAIDSYITECLRSSERLIIEGIQIFLYSYPEELKDQSIIIKNTSALKSAIRAYKRNRYENWSRGWSQFEIISDIYHNLFVNYHYPKGIVASSEA